MFIEPILKEIFLFLYMQLVLHLNTIYSKLCMHACLLPYEDYHIIINFYSTSIPPLILIISSKRLCTQFILFII